MPLPYLHYDVFTREALRGNQLAVFPDGRPLDAARMQAIAREMNFSESSFILPAETPGTDVRMRIFTPVHEMPMAGHPVIGSAFALADTGAVAPGAPRVVFGLNIGPTPVDLEWRAGRLAFAWMLQRPPEFGPPLRDPGAAAAAVGLTARDLADGLPVQQVSCGVPFLLVPLRDRQAVDRAASDAAAGRRLAETTGAVPQIFLFAFDDEDGTPAAYSRMFAPAFGIVEDAATGSASGPLGCYLVRHRLVVPERAHRIVSRQGVAMGRASTIHIAIDGTPEAITAVRVGGEAVLVARGEMVGVE